VLALNQALAKENLPGFLQVADAGYTANGAILALLQDRVLSSILVSEYSNLLLTAVRHSDPAVILLKTSQQWYQLKIHGVLIRQYLTLGLNLA
jgi:hypothetical protein